MVKRAWLPVAAIGLSLFVAACSAKSSSQPSVSPQAPADARAQAASEPPPDPVLLLIEKSRRHFDAGERELKVGHLDRARVEFDRAVDVLLESPYGARTDARMREHFDRLIDRINAYEVTALAQGDGFAEKRYDPASIDELLEIATFASSFKPGTEATVRADLETTEHDIDIPQNERVLSYVELFQGRLRDYIHESLTRGTKYLPMIQNVFRAEGLPLDLAYIPIIESGFKTNALSKASAKGPWQFMRATGLEQGLAQNWYVDERSDPEKSTLAAARYLKMLGRLFNGDWHLALAAYNGGMGRVQRAMQAAGTDDFWRLSARPGFLPRETRDYVPLILAAIIVAKNPAQYGFDIVPHDPLAYDTVTLARAVDLRRIAEWTGTSVQEIQALNPELRRWTTPLRQPEYTLRVPVGLGELLQARLDGATAAELNTLNWYTVQRGETLATIARKLRVSRADLAEANHLSVRSTLRAGQSLVIPRAPTTLLATRTDREAPATVASRSVAGTAGMGPRSPETPVVRASQPRAPQTQNATVYRVRPGDTLSRIARLHGTTVSELMAWNGLSSSRIVVGERLKILR